MDLLALSRLTEALQSLEKDAEPAPVQPSVLAPDREKTVAHGTQGRLSRPAVGGVRLKKMQGPRSYGPRLKIPGS